MMADKSVEECIKEISECAERMYCTELDMPRCEKAETLKEYADHDSMKAEIIKNPVDAVNKALSEADGDTLVAVCGSLYLAGEIRRKFK